MSTIPAVTSYDLLVQDAQEIENGLHKQFSALCLTECPIVEEIIDTQVFGFSKEVSFAQRVGLVSETQAHQLTQDLQRALNDLYNDVYQERQSKGV